MAATYHRMGDLTLGLNVHALAILALLHQEEPDFADYNEEHHRYEVEIDTRAWYNGRESGVALMVQKALGRGQCLIITFGRDRASDMTYVQHWFMDQAPINGPTVADLEAADGSLRFEFPPLDFTPVLEHIKATMKRFYQLETMDGS